MLAHRAALATDSVKETRDARCRPREPLGSRGRQKAGRREQGSSTLLLDKERELFHSSEKRINQEVKMQARTQDELQTLAELRKQKRRTVPPSTCTLAGSRCHILACHTMTTSNACYGETTSGHPSTRTCPRTKGCSADAPSHPPAMLDRGDDDAAMEAGNFAAVRHGPSVWEVAGGQRRVDSQTCSH